MIKLTNLHAYLHRTRGSPIVVTALYYHQVLHKVQAKFSNGYFRTVPGEK